MFKMILLSTFIKSIYSQGIYSQVEMPGSQVDNHRCSLDGGYTWCKSTRNCVRMWLTPCPDNYDNCDDCLAKQRDGINIACPQECDIVHIPSPPPLIVSPPIAIDPTPPIVIEPIPCPDVMCMMYCPNGHQIDKNNCQICACNEDETTIPDCDIVQPSCDDYNFVCPKITEITNCNEGGIDGYTTFQVSLIIKRNKNVRNIYALFGDKDNIMLLPPSYQVNNGENVGGVQPYIIGYNHEMMYDSWLTIGITNGDIQNKISAVGIDFDIWNTDHSLRIDNGAIFAMDPDNDIVIDDEYIIGQFTVRTFSNPEIVINVQGKTMDPSNSKSWVENNIRFNLISPRRSTSVPNNCISWFDGCNTCTVTNGVIQGCTRMMCFREEPTRCLEYETAGH